MIFLPALVSALLASKTAQAAAVAKRQADAANFKCQDGYVLTSYTSSGVATCTRVEGSNISPGYSGQTVVFVGLVSGLTGLIVACMPVGRYVFEAGVGFFRGNPPQWHGAFPRSLIDSDSAVTTRAPQDYAEAGALEAKLHSTWAQTLDKLQAHTYDANSTYVPFTNETHAIGTIIHNGFKHEHAWYLAPLNETHNTWKSHYQITQHTHDASADGSGALEKRTRSWSGARINYGSLPLNGKYYSWNIQQAGAHEIALVLTAKYLDSVTNQYPGRDQLCSYLGSETPGHPYASLISFASEDGYEGPFPESVCDNHFDDGLLYTDEL